MRQAKGLMLRVIAVFLSMSAIAMAEDTLTITTWGGAYEQSQMKAFFAPFTAQTGIKINVEQYNGGLDEIREQIESGVTQWDVVDLVVADNIQGCEEKLLTPIDHTKLIPSTTSTDIKSDFHPSTLTECGVGQVVYSTVIAFNPNQFGGVKPSNIDHFFDIESFPGKRGLQRQPAAIMEWALLSYGIPAQDIYNLLSTDRGLELALKRLDEIKSHIVWWENAADPVELLQSGKVVMSSGFNGRFFDAIVNQNASIQIIWDGQLTDFSTWAIPSGSPNIELANQFIRFSTSPNQLAEITRHISYGPVRKSSQSLVWKHEGSGVDIRPYLPTYPANAERALFKDHAWYARTNEIITKRFNAWLKK